MKIQLKNIKGIEHRRCKDCGKWIPFKVNNTSQARCINCIHIRDNQNSKGKRDILFDNLHDPKVIERELKGGLVPGLFTGCSEEQIAAMRMGNVNALLAAAPRIKRNERH